jgi:hypothetical protein
MLRAAQTVQMAQFLSRRDALLVIIAQRLG